VESWEPSQHSLIDTGKPRKPCVEVAGRRTFRILTSSQQSGKTGSTAFSKVSSPQGSIWCFLFQFPVSSLFLNPLNPELNPICYLLALLGAHHFLHVSRIRVKLLTFRLLINVIYIYGAPILDVSRSHTTTQHSR